MRVLFFSHLYPNSQRSVNCFVHRQVRALAREGCDVQVLRPVPWSPRLMARSEKRRQWVGIPRENVIEGVPVTYSRYPAVPRGRALGLQSYGMAVGVCRDLRRMAGEADILHAHMVYPDGFTASFLRRALGLRIPLCVTAHGSDVRLYGVRHATAYQVARCVRRADAVITGHPEIVGLLAKMGRDDVAMIHNGMDLEEFSGWNRSSVRADLGLQEGCRVVAYVGNLNRFKDPVTFVRAVPRMIERKDCVVVLVVGDGPLRPMLEELAGELRIGQRIRFLGYRRDVARILAVADVFVATSPVENIWSTAMLEAMAARVPCVVTRAGTTSAHLTHREHAYLVEPEDPASVADGVIDVLTDEALASRLRARARDLVEQSFDVNRSAQQLMALYQRLVSESSQR